MFDQLVGFVRYPKAGRLLDEWEVRKAGTTWTIRGAVPPCGATRKREIEERGPESPLEIRGYW